MHRFCLDSVADCSPAALCAGCLGRAIASARPQARVLGACWAERVARITRGREQSEAWPDTPAAREIARRKVAQLATDPRMVEPLTQAAMAGAAAWWARRGPRYR